MKALKKNGLGGGLVAALLVMAVLGLFSLTGYMTGLTDADLQRERDELLATTAEKLKETKK